jgi:hypothetical protein
MTMSKFRTLLLREWMQHRTGWLILFFSLPAFFFIALLFPHTLQIDGEVPEPLALAAIATMASTFVVGALAVLVATFQAPGLAWRDVQDRSIEFWLSLPVGHVPAIGATLLAHVFAMPLAALGAGWLCSLVLGLQVIIKLHGLGALGTLPWGTLAAFDLNFLLGMAIGLVLATLWLLPFLMLTMVAAAWLKRWGTPVVVVGLGGAHLLLAQVYGITWIGDVSRALVTEAGHAVFHTGDLEFHSAAQLTAWVVDASRWQIDENTFAAWRSLGQPLFAGALLFSAACFGLLVLRRQRYR